MKRFLLVVLMLGLLVLAAGCASNEEAAEYSKMLDQFPGEWVLKYDAVEGIVMPEPIITTSLILEPEGTGSYVDTTIKTGQKTVLTKITWRGMGEVNNRIYIEAVDESYDIINDHYTLSDDKSQIHPDGSIVYYVRV